MLRAEAIAIRLCRLVAGVVLMEAWFHGDKEAIRNFYGAEFRLAALSPRMDIENIPKSELFSGLQAATANCKKGGYSKG